MNSALRRLSAACSLTLLAATVDAKTRTTAATPVPAACADYYSRVNGAASNLPAFQQAYAFKTGQPMFKPDTEQTALWR